jgi:phage portal protein BeeE
MPTYNNIQSLNVEYYSQCLQRLIEDIELCLDEGLGMGENIGTEFDLDGLLRMDSVTQMSVLKEAVGAAVMAPNEARKKIDLKPVTGGESPMIQEQNYSLAAIAKRDAKEDPWGAAASSQQHATEPDDARQQAEERAFFAEAALSFQKGLAA